MKTNGRQIRIAATTGLLAMSLGIFMGINHQLGLATTELGTMRGPASQIMEAVKSAKLLAERKLVHRLSKVSLRKTASIGRDANELENFRFGILEGKYQVAIKDNQISYISFIDNPNTEGRPTFVRDRSEFLSQNKKLLGLGEVKERISVDLVGSRVVETYRVATDKQDKDVIIKFTLDDMDRLISLEKQVVSGLKYF